MLTSDNALTIKASVKRTNEPPNIVARQFEQAVFAPDIVEAILTGHQLFDLTADALH